MAAYSGRITNKNTILYIDGVSAIANQAAAASIVTSANQIGFVRSISGGGSTAGEVDESWGGDFDTGADSFEDITIVARYNPAVTDISGLAKDADVGIVIEVAEAGRDEPSTADDITYLARVGKVASAPINNIVIPDAGSRREGGHHDWS